MTVSVIVIADSIAPVWNFCDHFTVGFLVEVEMVVNKCGYGSL